MIQIQRETCGDCGATWEVHPGRLSRHECGAPGNPTPHRIGQEVPVRTADGGTVPGVITGLRVGPWGGGSAEVYVRAWMRSVRVQLSDLPEPATAA